MSQYNVLKPIAGITFFPCSKGEIDTFQNRWNRHFHTLYGMNFLQLTIYNNNFHGQPNNYYGTLLDHPITSLMHTPYWDISDIDDLRYKNRLNYHDARQAPGFLGLLDYLNLTQPISILLIALVAKMNNSANWYLSNPNFTVSTGGNSVKIPTSHRIKGTMIKVAALMIDLFLRLPFGLVASRTTHVFDIVKRLAAIVIATVTAGATQSGAMAINAAQDLMDYKRGYAMV